MLDPNSQNILRKKCKTLDIDFSGIFSDSAPLARKTKQK